MDSLSYTFDGFSETVDLYGIFGIRTQRLTIPRAHGDCVYVTLSHFVSARHTQTYTMYQGQGTLVWTYRNKEQLAQDLAQLPIVEFYPEVAVEEEVLVPLAHVSVGVGVGGSGRRV
jgi:hypothetical protein